MKNEDMMIWVLDDDNEVMESALGDKDFDEENKIMNRALIKKHNKIIDKIKNKLPLSKLDLRIIQDANEIHLNDELNYNGHHKEAVKLDEYLKDMLGK